MSYVWNQPWPPAYLEDIEGDGGPKEEGSVQWDYGYPERDEATRRISLEFLGLAHYQGQTYSNTIRDIMQAVHNPTSQPRTTAQLTAEAIFLNLVSQRLTRTCVDERMAEITAFMYRIEDRLDRFDQQTVTLFRSRSALPDGAPGWYNEEGSDSDLAVGPGRETPTPPPPEAPAGGGNQFLSFLPLGTLCFLAGVLAGHSLSCAWISSRLEAGSATSGWRS